MLHVGTFDLTKNYQPLEGYGSVSTQPIGSFFLSYFFIHNDFFHKIFIQRVILGVKSGENDVQLPCNSSSRHVLKEKFKFEGSKNLQPIFGANRYNCQAEFREKSCKTTGLIRLSGESGSNFQGVNMRTICYILF